jgi:hypothetical protein
LELTLKEQLRVLLGEQSPEWRLLHGLRLRFERVLPPRLEPTMSVQEWIESGQPVPPPHAVKERILAAYASAFDTGTLIETGTYAGEMVWAMKDRFGRIFSIELSESLARRARRRFQAFEHIGILCGDSGYVLPRFLSRISTRCLFWLDGHYSAGITVQGKTATPVIQELEAIMAHGIEDHVILVDDARLFTGAGGFPGVQQLRALVSLRRPGWDFSVRNDVIRIHRRRDVASEF